MCRLSVGEPLLPTHTYTAYTMSLNLAEKILKHDVTENIQELWQLVQDVRESVGDDKEVMIWIWYGTVRCGSVW